MGKVGAPLGNDNHRKGGSIKPRKKVQDDIRAKIRSTLLIGRLEKHAEGKLKLENSQIKAIEILLDRTIPKLSSVEMHGPGGGAITVEIVRFGGGS